MLAERVYADLDARLAPVDSAFARNYPGDATGRQPVHTVYLPADRYRSDVVAQWGERALSALDTHAPLPFPEALYERVVGKLRTEPIEDLRVDFEDGYGIRDDAHEDAAARAAGSALRSGPLPPFVGLRCKSLVPATRRRAVRTLDVVLDALGPPPPGFVITLPKVHVPEQVAAFSVLCGQLESAHGLPEGALRFEVQVETTQAVLDLPGIIRAGQGRLVGLHYGTYDYSAACGIAAGQQALDHPVADHAKAVMQVAAAGTGVRLSDGSSNVLPVGDDEAVQTAWRLHAGLVRRSLERGFYQGWDLHPAQLPTRFAANYAFFRDGAAATVARLRAYLDQRVGGVLDEPATARAMAGFLLRGLHCGALDEHEVGVDRAVLETL